MIISLVGYMGSGKSTVGKLLADALGYDFIDLDDEITRINGQSIEQIFKVKGEIKFRKIEHEVLKSVLNIDNLVLALGGGTPVYYNNMDLINENSVSFYLRMNPVELSERLIKEKEHRPLIKHLNDEDLIEFIAKHLFERNLFYDRAKYTLSGAGEAVQVKDKIIGLLLKVN